MSAHRKRHHVIIEVEEGTTSDATPVPTESPGAPEPEADETSHATASNGTPIVESEKKRKIFPSKRIPNNWKQVYGLIKDYRDKNPDGIPEKVFRFHSLVSMILSTRCSPAIVSQAMASLKSHQPGGLTVESIEEMDVETLCTYMRHVQFNRQKAGYIKKIAQILNDKHDGDIPHTVEGLRKLPGVGPTTAYLCMHYAWKKVGAFRVDWHAHRILHRLGWENTMGLDRVSTGLELESWLPQEYLAELNSMLTVFGEYVCTPLEPNCEGCPVRQLCPKIGLP
ncbi:hypothetical protein SeLEV6574_g03032 [Synchytrium endobioticum]|nr:hypothetical protein SeLEV6574_g03032 [Synchytrium endobioticum]